MEIILIGMSHKSAPLEVRERAAISCGDASNVVSHLKDAFKAAEVFYACTCNRVEILAVAKDIATVERGSKGLLTATDEELYRYLGIEAVRHLLRVVSSLDSLVIGEPQILGQMKSAYAATLSAGGAGLIINKLLHASFRTAKLVREQTRIAANPVSVSYAAVELAKRIFSKLSDKRVLLLGAGDMALLAAKHLAASGVKEMVFANRTFSTARDLAASFNGAAIAFGEIATGIANADIVIASTGASSHIVSAEMVGMALKKNRKSRPLFIIDIAVPRDVHPAVGDIDGVYLYNIDELQGVVADNIASRQEEAQKAEAIVVREAEKFADWWKSLDLVPTIVALRNKVQQITAAELQASSGWLSSLTEKDQERVRHLLLATANKFLHGPSEKLKEAQATDMARGYAAILHDLFSL